MANRFVTWRVIFHRFVFTTQVYNTKVNYSLLNNQ